MGQELGILTMAAQLGVEAILVKPKRSIGPFVAQVTISEVHTDELEITDHPVEMGAAVTDHAYMKPSELVVECAWSDSPQNIGLISGLAGAVTGTINGISSILSGAAPNQMRDTYLQLLILQKSRTPFDVFTGKRVYQDMVFKSLVVHTDKTKENVLSVTAHLRQVIIVQTQVLDLNSAPAENQLDPQSTSSLLDKGTKQLADGLPKINPGAAARSLISSPLSSIATQAQSALSTASSGVSGLFT